MTQISTIGINTMLTGNLQKEQATLSLLNEQLASSQQHSNLTDYAPTDAKQIVDFHNSIAQKQAYLSSITTVQNRLTVYDATMTDMETVASSAGSLASQNSSYNAATASKIQSQAQSYLSQVADDLNQKFGDRYIYAGTRYTTQPVTSDSTVLNGAPQSIITNAANLPSYDSQVPAVATSTVSYGAALPGGVSNGSTLPTANTTVYDASGTSHSLNYSWSKTSATGWDLTVTAPDVASFTTVVPFTFDPTTNALTSISNYASSPAAPSSYTVGSPTGTGNSADVNVSLTFPGQPSAQSIDLNFGTYDLTSGAKALMVAPAASAIAQTTFSQDGKATTFTNASSYTADTVMVDSSYSVTYGVSSNDPSFQKLINGLRYMNAAVNAGKAGDTATYQSDMLQASQMLATALNGVQTLHSNVANNQNILTQETTTQNANVSALQNNLGTIQNVDTTQVATELTLLQTQLQASYSATGSFLKLSLVQYL